MSFLPQDWLSAVDIFILSVLVYVVLRRAQSAKRPRTTFIILLVGSIVFGGAKYSGLELTSRLVDGLLWLGAVVFVVLFQEDIRRELELMFIPKKHRGGEAAESSPILTLLRVVETLCQTQTGGIIVLERDVSLAEHSRLGIALDGLMSEPLLLSIFDHHSPGHDGAVVVRGQKVVSFGLHLPLSRKSGNLDRLGTRHAAALGISEITDALVICVSEEDGCVSIASLGELREVNLAELKKELELFHGEKIIRVESPAIRWGRPAATGFASILISLVVSYFYSTKTVSVLRDVQVPLSFTHLSKSLGIGAIDTEEVMLRLEGDVVKVREYLNRHPAVIVNLENFGPGEHNILISESGIELPEGVKLTKVDPVSIPIQIVAFRGVEVPVAIRADKPQVDAPSLKITPDRVKIEVAEGDHGPALVYTELVDFDELKKAGVITKSLVLPEGARFIQSTPPKVTISITKPARKRTLSSEEENQ